MPPYTPRPAVIEAAAMARAANADPIVTLGGGSVTESFARMAEAAMHTPWVPRNPRPIAGPDQLHEILELAA